MTYAAIFLALAALLAAIGLRWARCVEAETQSAEGRAVSAREAKQRDRRG